MKRAAAFRITGEICFYFAILSYFPQFAPWRLPMAYFALASFPAGLLAAGLDAAPLRLLVSLLPGLCFLRAELSLFLILPAFAWVYLILCLTIGHFNVPAYDYRKTFRILLLVSCAWPMISAADCILFGGEFLSTTGLAYLALFMLLGVLALRQMRMGATMDTRWHTINALTVAATLIVTVGVSLGFYRLVVFCMPVFTFILSSVWSCITWLFSLLVPPGEFVEETIQKPPPPNTSIRVIPEALQITEEEHVYQEEEEEVSRTLVHLTEKTSAIGLIIIIAVVLLIVLWLLIRHARRGSLGTGEDDYCESTESIPLTRRKRKKKAAQETEADRVRHVRNVYREYLRYLRQNGLHRTASNTSAEILSESERISAASASEEEALRSIYLKARYSVATITGEDVATARHILDAIRSRDQVNG